MLLVFKLPSRYKAKRPDTMTAKRSRISIRHQVGLTQREWMKQSRLRAELYSTHGRILRSKRYQFRTLQTRNRPSTLFLSINTILVSLATLTPIKLSIGQTLEMRLHTKSMLLVEIVLRANMMRLHVNFMLLVKTGLCAEMVSRNGRHMNNCRKSTGRWHSLP